MKQMRSDFIYVPTIPVELAQKKAKRKVHKSALVGAAVATICTGYWIAGLLIFIVLFGLNLWYTKDL